MDRASLLEQVKAREELERRKIDARCKIDPMFWLRNYTATFDPKAKKDGLDSVRPFPDWIYLDLVMYFMTRPKQYPRMFIPKSREVLTSWSASAYCAHLAQYTPYAQVLIQSEDEQKSTKLIAYAKTLYSNQPEWLRKLHPLKGGYIQTGHARDKELELRFASGSELIGIASTPNKVASFHCTAHVIDEGALWDEAELSYQLSLPVSAQIIVISSARPGWFAEAAGASSGPNGIPESIDIDATRKMIDDLNSDPDMQALISAGAAPERVETEKPRKSKRSS